MAAATMTWPPPRPADPEIPHRPWDPRHHDQPTLVEEHDRLLYVVVDELVDDWVGLSVSPWPHADQEGRLRFVDTEPAAEVGTSRDKLLRFLGKEASDDGAGVRVGTTFAVRVREGRAASVLERLRDRAGHGEARIENLGTFCESPVDLTPQGRLIAKLASYSAMLSTLPTEVEKQWNLAEEQAP